MQFTLEPDNWGQPDEQLLADLQRVSALVKPAGITKKLYDKHGRWCSATMRKRFGNWNLALERAGIWPTKLMNIPRDHLLEDLRAVSKSIEGAPVTRDQYNVRGKFSPVALSRAFGGWNKALRAANLLITFEPKPLTDERCFQAIEVSWRRLGGQPRMEDVRPPEASVSGPQIKRRFGSWRKALEVFVVHVNRAGDTKTPVDSPTATDTSNSNGASHRKDGSSPRTAGYRLRFLVMRRDRFRCRKCGRSPATHLGLALVVDHIVPWSEGGPTIYENLQTLCEPCNGGRGTLELDVP